MAAASVTPPLPDGFQLEASAPPPLPPGFEMEGPKKLDQIVKENPSLKNQDTRALIRGVPVVGPMVANRLGAGLRSLAEGGSYAEKLQQENEAEKAFEAEHPVLDAVSQGIGGTLALGGAGGASTTAARALGMTGKLLPAARNAAMSGASIGAIDAAVRGGDPSEAAAIGAGTGALGVAGGKLLGKGVQAIREAVRPGAPVPRTIDVNGQSVPVRESVITGSPDTSREEQALLRAGQPAAMEGEDATAAAMRAAHGDFTEGLAPGAPHPESPMAAADTASGDLVSQEAQRAAAEVQRGTQAAADLTGIRTDLNPATPGPETPYGAGHQVSEAIQQGAQQARAARTAAYQAQERIPGEFNPDLLSSAGDEIRAGLNAPTAPGGRVMISDNVTPMAAQALKVIDNDVSRLRFPNESAPRVDIPEAPASTQHARDVADIRAKFGDEVANLYDSQNRPAGPATVPSLLQFIASKGGLAPHAELDAIGLANGHRAQVPGQSGFFGVVRKNGANIDRMREAAEEAGYLRGKNGETSTPRDFLDAVEAELRGQKRYPEGHENFRNKREGVAGNERQRAEEAARLHGFEAELDNAGHGGLEADVKKRAATLMADEGLHADDAVEHALLQLEQEEAAGGVRAAAPSAPAEPEGFTPADIEQTRKALVQLRSAANRAARQNGNWEDARAVGRVMDEFDQFVTRTAQQEGGFSGDSHAYLAGQERARALHANYRQTYSAAGPGDKVGRFIENVIGKYPGQELTPDAIAAKLFGNAREPGGSDTVAIVQRLRNMFGADSPEWGAIRKAALSHLTEDLGAPLAHAEQADRILRFLQGSKGRLLAETLFDPTERAHLATYAQRVRQVVDPIPQAGTVEHKIARLSGRLTGEPATGEQILSELSGKQGAQLAGELRNRLTPEAFANLKRGLFMKISQAPEGMIPWGDQKVGQNIERFLATDLAREMFTPAERARMDLMGRAHLRLVPIPGTTNPSGTAHMGERLAKGLKSQMLTLLGFSHGGMPGAAAAAALAKGLEWRASSKAANRASELFLGPHTRSAAPRIPQAGAALFAPSTASIRDRSARQ